MREVSGLDGWQYNESYEYIPESESEDENAEQLQRIKRIVREAAVKPLDLETDDSPQGRLKRELRAEALRRYEEAARTPKEFAAVVATWDKLDANRERKERSHEILSGDIPLADTADLSCAPIFPRWMGSPIQRQLVRGYFLDYLADCPYEMHDLTDKPYLQQIIRDLKEDHKEIFYFLFIRQYSPQRLAALRGQTDRNIRKVRDTVMRKIWKKMYKELSGRNDLSEAERDFCNRYVQTGGKLK